MRRWSSRSGRRRGPDSTIAIAAADEAGEPFIAWRFHEGLRWRRIVEHYVPEAQTKRVLDVGAGNGAIELAFAAGGAAS